RGEIMNVMERRAGSTAAAMVLGVQATATVVGALALLAYGSRHPGRGYGLGGLFVLLLAGMVVGVAVGVARGRYWAHTAAVVGEMVLALGSLSRLKTRPAVAIVGLILEGTALVLLARRPRHDRPGPPPPTSPTVEPP